MCRNERRRLFKGGCSVHRSPEVCVSQPPVRSGIILWEAQFNLVVDHQRDRTSTVDLHRHRLPSLDLLWLQHAYLRQYVDTTHMKVAPLRNCIGFVDETVRPICRHTRNQRVCYNGHKRIHALKFQSVVVHNGLRYCTVIVARINYLSIYLIANL